MCVTVMEVALDRTNVTVRMNGQDMIATFQYVLRLTLLIIREHAPDGVLVSILTYVTVRLVERV
ncbi:hypothetical protein D3C80_2147390 [compost metagenome]